MAAASSSMAPEVKTEPGVEPIDLENRIIELLMEFSDGLSDDDLASHTTNIDPKQRATAINRLLSTGKIEMKKHATGVGFLFTLKNQEAAEKIKGATAEETLVYQLIEETGNKGIWIRDIRVQSGLKQQQLTKVLKQLETRKLVKSIKAVNAGRKKAYMLFELEPDQALTGGTFYADQEFDIQFVDLLNQQCIKFLRARAQFAADRHPDNLAAQKQASFVQCGEVWQHINDLQISRVDLPLEDVERVLDTVVHDGEAERRIEAGKAAYRYTKPLLKSAGLVSVPCTFCPLFSDCRPGTQISPETCVYYKEWLSEI